jgi:hypothetical protein
MALFHVSIEPNENQMRKRVEAGRPITCPIHIRIGDTVFPHETWDDFAAVILGWWLQGLDALRRCQSNCVELLFMDGPYEVRVIRNDSADWLVVGVVRGLQERELFRATAAARDVLDAVINAAVQLLTSVKGGSMWDTDCQTLWEVLQRLEGSLP